MMFDDPKHAPPVHGVDALPPSCNANPGKPLRRPSAAQSETLMYFWTLGIQGMALFMLLFTLSLRKNCVIVMAHKQGKYK
jgi:hypothetical protein